MASSGSSEFNPGRSVAAEIPPLPFGTGVVRGVMGGSWESPDDNDPLVKAGVALSSSGDSVTLLKAMGGPGLDPDTSEDVRDCATPSPCKIGELC